MVDVDVNDALSSALDSIKVCMSTTETFRIWSDASRYVMQFIVVVYEAG
jgi:hypothetical protein